MWFQTHSMRRGRYLRIPLSNNFSAVVCTQLVACTTTKSDEVFGCVQPLTSHRFDQKVKAILDSANGLAQPA